MAETFKSKWTGNLDPCRYCGFTVPMLQEKDGWYSLVCMECGAQGPAEKTEDAAAESWNGARLLT